MAKMIITDTDFLSSFLKIGRLSLVFRAFGTNKIIITSGVLQELEQAPMRWELKEALQSEEHKIIVKEIGETLAEGFGRGEMESMALAAETNSLLLMDDRKAAQYAKQKGITVMGIAAFLLYCKTNKVISKEDLQIIITELKEKDYYQFNEEVRGKLLE